MPTSTTRFSRLGRLVMPLAWCGVAVLAMMLATAWYGAWYYYRDGYVAIWHGRVEYVYIPGWGENRSHRGLGHGRLMPPRPILTWDIDHRFFTLGWSNGKPNLYCWGGRVPLWLVALLLVTPYTIRRVVRLRRVPPNHCPRCRYNRAGLAADALCPECGAANGAGIEAKAGAE